jgi:hypothetical protein
MCCAASVCLSIFTKIEMWVMRNHNLPYACHDTNVVIEIYTCKSKNNIESKKVMTLWKTCGLVHSRVIKGCFVTLLVLEFEKELGVCPEHNTIMICCY